MNPFDPIAGNQPKDTEKIRISRMPDQNVGMDIPNNPTMRANTSIHRLRCTAERTPSPTPIIVEMSVLANVSAKVAGRCIRILGNTGSLFSNDLPKSP
jgi:hypothetical protein